MRRTDSGITMFLIILTALLFSACAKRDISIAKSGAPARVSEFLTDAPERLYILTASQAVEVRKIDAAVKQIESVVRKNGGYVQSQSVREEEQAYLVLRVPAPQLRPVLDAAASLGTEESRSVASQDVTEQFIDTEARLKNAIALRDRMKALLSHAKDVKDILEIERELTRVQSDIDSMEGRLKKLKGQVDLAQIDLKLKRQRTFGPLGYVFYGIGWVIQKLFVIN